MIRLIMRFRGQKEYRHIREFCEGGLERVQFRLNPIRHLRQFQTVVNRLGRQIECEKLCPGNLLLTDEALKVYTCLYIGEAENGVYLFKGKDMPV